MRRHSVFIFIAAISFLSFTSTVSAESGGSNITGSSITHNYNAGGPIAADLDSVPPGDIIWDWAVWDTSSNQSNELSGGPATISPVNIFWNIGPSTTPGNAQSWSMSFTNAQNGSPSSGSNFGYGNESFSTIDTGTFSVDVTPNVPIGASGTVRVFGETDLGGFFGSMTATNTIATSIDGNSDADGDQAWTMDTAGQVRDSWMYEFTFENYGGETFCFSVTTSYLVQNPRLNIAAVQVSTPMPPQTTPPDSFSIITGTLDSGGLNELLFSDDQYLVIDPTFTMFRYQQAYTVDATSPTDTPSALEFNLESHVFNIVGTIDQQIELFNYNTGQFEVVDNRLTTATDSVANVIPGGDPTRFVEAGTGAMRARISYQNSFSNWIFMFSAFFLPYETRADHIFWQITP